MDYQRKGRLMYGFTTTPTHGSFEQALSRNTGALQAIAASARVSGHGAPIRAV